MEPLPGSIEITFPLAFRRAVARRLEAVRERMGDVSDDPLHFMTAPAPERPTDAALLRLLPDAVGHPSGEDPTDRLASDARRVHTDHDLRARKVSDSEHVQGQMQQEGLTITLSPRDIEVWLRALNDARLLIAGDLGLTEPDSLTKLMRDLNRVRTPGARERTLIDTVVAYEQLAQVQQVLLEAESPEMAEQIEMLIAERPWLDR